MFQKVIQPAHMLVDDERLNYDGRPGNEIIAKVFDAAPGAESIALLLNIEKSELSPADRVTYLKCWQKQASWVNFQEQEALLYVSGSHYQENSSEFDVDNESREEVAAALRLAPSTSQEKIDVARTLFTNLQATTSALNAGEIPTQTATIIAKEVALALRAGLSQEAVQHLEAQALSHAEFHTPSQVAKKIKTVFANIAPEVYKEHFELQRQVRKIQLIKEDGGTGTILATLKIEDAQFADQVINDYADTILANLREKMLTEVKFCRSHKCIRECRVKCAHACSEYCKEECLVLNFDNQEALDALDQANSLDLDFERNVRRADAFIAAMKAADAALKANGTIITRHNRRPTINVTIDLPTALGLAENPGQLAGYGPIPANIAREIAADGRWKRFVTDPITGTLIDYGRETYEPPQNLQDFLIARDRTCRFPGCRQPAHLADLDHAIPWDEGGTTSADNLGALCRRHHNLKTHGGWQLINGINGACTWISPTGARYEVPARPIMDAI
jgi:hypothetical protein